MEDDSNSLLNVSRACFAANQDAFAVCSTDKFIHEDEYCNAVAICQGNSQSREQIVVRWGLRA